MRSLIALCALISLAEAHDFDADHPRKLAHRHLITEAEIITNTSIYSGGTEYVKVRGCMCQQPPVRWWCIEGLNQGP